MRKDIDVPHSADINSITHVPSTRESGDDADLRIQAELDRAFRRRGWAVFAATISICLLVWINWTVHPIGLAYDPDDEKCLPDLHLSLTVKGNTRELHDGDLAYWKPAGPLAWVKRDIILKMVAAVPGDHLQVQGDRILVNGREVTRGLALVNVYRTSVQALQRDEVVPPGKVFMLGLHPRSDDSRYWGYVDQSDLVGRAYKIW